MLDRRKFIVTTGIVAGGLVLQVPAVLEGLSESAPLRPLDRINLRRLILAVEKHIRECCERQFLEPNDPITWANCTRDLETVLQGMKNRGVFKDFKVRCDETTNRPETIDKHEMHGSVLVKPNPAIEFIDIRFVMSNEPVIEMIAT